MRGIPQIYAGDEIGMPGGDDPDNRRDFPGGFPGDKRNAFTAPGRSEEEQKVFEQVRTLLHLRQQHPALRLGRYLHIFSDDQTFVYVRDFGGAAAAPERLLMVMNNADQPRTVEININDTVLAHAHRLSKLLAEHEATLTTGNKVSVPLPARSLSIYRVD
jgi:glycosidase